MSDIVERLRKWAISRDSVPASDLMDEAADEIERLRLTERERSLLEILSARLSQFDRATLRGLLERLGGVTEPMPETKRAEGSVVLTDAERDDLRVWLTECLRQASTATEGGSEELAERWLGRSRRAAAMLERLGGVTEPMPDPDSGIWR